jgi:hypothetical protein
MLARITRLPFNTGREIRETRKTREGGQGRESNIYVSEAAP